MGSGDLSDINHRFCHVWLAKRQPFTYDNLNRLNTAQVSGLQSYATNFAPNGNITNKSDAGTYQYDPIKIHALAQLNAYNNVSTGNQDVVYTKFQRPEKITENGKELTYTYASDYERREAVFKMNGSIVYSRLYFGDYELTIQNGVYEYVHYITGGDGLCAIVVRSIGSSSGSGFKFYVPYTDHLGSIVTVTDLNGAVVAEQNFDAWGRKRNATTWDYANVAANPTWLYRGYTGHEHLPEFNLINMNARLYDPVLGRMLSPDNYVSVGGSQGMNRYTYANNNPLSYSDPDGNFWHIVIGAGVGGLINGFMHIDKPGGFWKGFAIGAVAGALTAATGGLAAGYYATGTAAGAWAGATTGIYSSGVIGGLISGGAGAVVGSPVLGGGNYLVFGDPYTGKRFLRDVLIGAGIGAVAGGIAAWWKGNNIWNNAPKAAGTTAWTSPKTNAKLLAEGEIIPSRGIGEFPPIDAPEGAVGGGNTYTGDGALIPADQAACEAGIANGPEIIGSYEVHGGKGLVGTTYNRNIFYIKALSKEAKTLANMRFLLSSFESEAVRAGADKISIFGASVINDKLFNPSIMARLGYSYSNTSNGIFLTKFLIR